MRFLVFISEPHSPIRKRSKHRGKGRGMGKGRGKPTMISQSFLSPEDRIERETQSCDYILS